MRKTMENLPIGTASGDGNQKQSNYIKYIISMFQVFHSFEENPLAYLRNIIIYSSSLI